MEKACERILLGHITGVSGLKGWIKVHSDTHPRENIFTYASWWLKQGGSWKQVKVVDGRPQGKTIVVQVEGVTSPEQASELVGAKIAVDRTSMPELSSGEYYWTDLTGMQVRTSEDVLIGPVSRLFETGANDVMVVTDEREQPESDTAVQTADKGQKGKTVREVLVPWLVPDVIKQVDMDNRMITVDWDPDF
ncbi:MAG: ribosome maturation factor RimM [Granulosicoccus sp.]